MLPTQQKYFRCCPSRNHGFPTSQCHAAFFIAASPNIEMAVLLKKQTAMTKLSLNQNHHGERSHLKKISESHSQPLFTCN